MHAVSLPTHFGFRDLTGQVFTRLTVMHYVGKIPMGKENRPGWWCKCSCSKATELPVTAKHLLNGHTQSCGCLHADNWKSVITKHGESTHELYGAFRTMITRCHNKNFISYQYYGAKGITVCDRWRESFANFLSDVPPRESSDLSLDRIDGSKGYEPGNVRWATRSQQARNTTRNVMITLDGETKCRQDWCNQYCIDHSVMISRVKRGWSLEDAIKVPVGHNRTTRDASHPTQ